MLQPATLRFLKELRKNNHKPWFDAHRGEYDSAKADFLQFLQQVINATGKKDPGIAPLAAKDCLFRINRDVRFSKDKSPYKTNFGASINKGGRKAMNCAGYYFHLEPGNSFMGGGLYMPEPATLQQVRQEIDYNFPAFRKLLNASAFKKTYGQLDNSREFLLQRLPRGYEPGNPAGDFLRLKSFIAMTPVSDKELLSPDLLKKTVAAFAALQPLIAFLNGSLD